MKAEGPFCGKQFFSDLSNGGEKDWGNALMARCDEDAARAYTARLSPGSYSQFLHIKDFGFSIPESAEISGIEVVIIRRADNENALRDRSVQLVRNGKTIGSNMASPELWENDWTAVFYGGQNDMWGGKWTAKALNDAGFGIVLDVGFAGSEGRAEVDEVLVTIHYAEPRKGVQAAKVAESPSRFSCRPIGS